MPSVRSIATFAVKFLVIYGALTASWPLCKPAYAFFLRESGQALIEAIGAGNRMRIRAATTPDGLTDTAIFVRDADGRAGQTEISSRMAGFQPTSLLIGLVVATPVSARRRLWALFAGLVMLHAFVLARLAMCIIFAPVVRPDAFWTNVFRWSVFDFIHGHAGASFVPVLIWVAVTMRREDARRLVGSTPKKVTA